jgi:hypothetical protein
MAAKAKAPAMPWAAAVWMKIFDIEIGVPFVLVTTWSSVVLGTGGWVTGMLWGVGVVDPGSGPAVLEMLAIWKRQSDEQVEVERLGFIACRVKCNARQRVMRCKS